MEQVTVGTLKKDQVFIHGGVMFTVMLIRDEFYLCKIGETEKGVYITTPTLVTVCE